MDHQNLTTQFPPSIFRKISFSWYDYTLFSVVLGFSSLIGIYFGCFQHQNTKKDYLLGGKTMKMVPIAISLVASHTSAITVLAIPADIYRYGIGFWQGSISLICLYFTTAYIFLPVFYRLELTSTYEYLALRFDEKTRMMASGLYAISLMLYLPIVIFVPALGFSAATGINIHLVAPIACGICVFYTTLGGLKAVVWSDTLQFTLTVGCLVSVVWVALNKAGGFGAMWETALEGHRLDIDFDLDPTKRDAFWTVVIGLSFVFTAQNSINQGCVQKFLALPTMEKAKTSCFMYCAGTVVMKSLSALLGLTMYAIYSGCDPFTTKQVKRNDQLVTYFIMEVSDGLPGLSGLFFAGVFCAALATLSANLNCVAGTLYTDFISKIVNKNITEKNSSNILKSLVVLIGICSWLMVYVVENLGGIVQLSIALKGVADGPLLGVFAMGVLSKRFNSKGAFCGGIFGMVFMLWIFFMEKYYENLGLIGYESKPLSTANCSYEFERNTTTNNFQAESSENVFFIFKLSFYLYGMLGTLATIFVGSVISFFTRNPRIDGNVPKELLSPIVHWMYPEPDNTEVVTLNRINGNYTNVQVILEKRNDDKD